VRTDGSMSARRWLRPRTFLVALCVAAVGATALAAPAQAAGSGSAARAHAVGPITKVTAQGTLTYGFRPAAAGSAGVRPDSASGCNINVCINIIGSSNYVTEWYTTAITEEAACTWADFLANGGIALSADVVCGDGPGVFYSYWYPARTFSSPTHACNRWFNMPGLPCETIKK
jgi:hypothetical protein